MLLFGPSSNHKKQPCLHPAQTTSREKYSPKYSRSLRHRASAPSRLMAVLLSLYLTLVFCRCPEYSSVFCGFPFFFSHMSIASPVCLILDSSASLHIFDAHMQKQFVTRTTPPLVVVCFTVWCGLSGKRKTWNVQLTSLVFLALAAFPARVCGACTPTPLPTRTNWA